MKICIVTDEVSADPETAIELGVEWGIRDFELRGFGTDRVPHFTTYQKDKLKEILEAHNARVVAISPGLFKCPFPLGSRQSFPLRIFDFDLHTRWQDARDLVHYHRSELLPLSIEFAREIGAGLIVAFSFQRQGSLASSPPDEILEVLGEAAQLVDDSGLQLAVEVEDGFWADSGQNAASLANAVGLPTLGINWDPANAFAVGLPPFPGGYEAVKEHVQHVHFKDVKPEPNGGVRYVTEGEIDWAGQIDALALDGYDGYISVEPHMEPKVFAARRLTKRLKTLVKSADERLAQPRARS